MIDAVAIAVGRQLRADTADPHTHRCTGDWPSAADPTAPLLRPVNHGGWPHETALTDKSIAHIIEKRSLAAGVARMRGHSLRAGAITEAFDRGASLEDVMALARHKNPATTLRYDRHREQRSARVDLGL
ncbi:tyrosine-type recombinase/integrase [Nocardia gamkensis]|uniref:tyrosine-type recombinase/integrase n=1 Tax=Nocardia gamkensis TaxID=352869 RepID=UPI0036EF8B95